ncbi:MAG: murein L,D-transpeptidase catalytic domain family protein [Bacteroidales bacterium]|nr:murein L,D-transpeptidase catalytic domain family protein [Bacteroidales bacterium]
MMKPISEAFDRDIETYFTFCYRALYCDPPKPGYEVFKRALTGFLNLKSSGNIRNNLLTIIDFSVSSNVERMWIVDIHHMKVIHNSLVAHGKESGDEYATQFSNIPSSNRSSLGFYLTGEIYYGKHGISLFLDGVEPGVNDKARDRAIVMHGAEYVSRKYINTYGRLGRSFGCPSIPIDKHEEIIRLLSGRSCIYIYYPDKDYFLNSRLYSAEKVNEGIYKLQSEGSGVSGSFLQNGSVP